jgi:hypothetical protein
MFDAAENCSSYELCSGIAGHLYGNIGCCYYVFIIDSYLVTLNLTFLTSLCAHSLFVLVTKET